MDKKLEVIEVPELPEAPEVEEQSTSHTETHTSGGLEAKFMGNHARFFFNRKTVTDTTGDQPEKTSCCPWLCG